MPFFHTLKSAGLREENSPQDHQTQTRYRMKSKMKSCKNQQDKDYSSRCYLYVNKTLKTCANDGKYRGLISCTIKQLSYRRDDDTTPNIDQFGNPR